MCKARAKGSTRPGSGSDWQEEPAAALGAAQGLQPWNTPAVSCSSMELKQALFTLTAAFKGKIQVDFEAVEFTDQFGFLQVCGVELWASE